MYTLLILGVGGLICFAWWAWRLQLRKSTRLSILMEALSRRRYFKFLSRVGVDVERYLDVIPVSRLCLHMERCEHCPNQKRCDAFLDQNRHEHDLHFCPNYNDLLSESKLMARR